MKRTRLVGCPLILSYGHQYNRVFTDLVDDYSCSPAPAPEEEEALKQALLAGLNENGQPGPDVEAPPPKKSRSWTSLFGSALVFVWPDDWVLQVTLTPVICAHSG
jgi:hypothetical protein